MYKRQPLGEVINKLRVHPEHSEDDVIDNDLILCWNNEKRIITGADLLGRLLRGIAGRNHNFSFQKTNEINIK